MSPILISVIVFVCICGGAMVGLYLRNRLPNQHLSGDTKDLVRLGTGLIATIAALVLGLLIASANGSYGTQASLIQQLTANVVILDRILTLYGPETIPDRKFLREGVVSMADQIWQENGSARGKSQPFDAGVAISAFYNELLKLSPQNGTQRVLQAKAIDAAEDLAKTRLLLFAKTGPAIPMPFLVVLISWLAIIFMSFSMFAERNATSIVALMVFALSAAASIFLILELSEPFTGIMMISSEPLLNALGPIGSS